MKRASNSATRVQALKSFFHPTTGAYVAEGAIFDEFNGDILPDLIKDKTLVAVDSDTPPIPPVTP